MADWKGMMANYFEAVKDVGKIEMPPFTPEEEEDPGPSAVDSGQGMTEAQVADTVKRIRAADRGSGPEFPHPFDEATAQVEKMIELGSAKQEVTLPPEVLAQLQRIEDLLNRIEEEHILRRTSSFTVRGVTWPGKEDG